MKIYVWSSRTFADWAAGDIIVMASNIDAAKKKAMKKYRDYAGGHYYGGVCNDMLDEPQIIEDGVYHVMGSG